MRLLVPTYFSSFTLCHSLCDNPTVLPVFLIHHHISAFSAFPWMLLFFCKRIEYMGKDVRLTISSNVHWVLKLDYRKVGWVVQFLSLSHFCSFVQVWRAMRRNSLQAKESVSENPCLHHSFLDNANSHQEAELRVDPHRYIAPHHSDISAA